MGCTDNSVLFEIPTVDIYKDEWLDIGIRQRKQLLRPTFRVVMLIKRYLRPPQFLDQRFPRWNERR
jgi:hypothetical protein